MLAAGHFDATEINLLRPWWLVVETEINICMIGRAMPGELFRSRGNSTSSEVASSSGAAAGDGLFRSSQSVSLKINEAELHAAVDALPSLPLVVQMILSKVGVDSKADAHDLEGLVSQDLAIATRLLKMVNSSFYALPNQVVDLGQAVAIIGFGSLRSLVLAASTAGVLSVQFPVYGFTERGLWVNSMASALLAKELAKMSNNQKGDPENYFVCGLLRDIGLLVLGPLAAEKGIAKMSDLAQDGNRHRSLTEIERETLGFDHSMAGKLIAEKWQLPDNVGNAIRYHERIPAGMSQEDHHLLATVRLADRLAARAEWGLRPDHSFDSDVSPKLMQACGIDPQALKNVIEKMPEMLATAMTEI